MEIRLQKYLADCGIASRRKAEELIDKGYISVNGQVIRIQGMKIDDKKDIINYKGKQVVKENKMIYIMLHKPVGYITTVKDQFDRPTVMDLLHDITERLYPVGRLDYDTSGLLILTNDGALTFKLTHPKHNIEKTYMAKLVGTPTKDDLDRFRKGLDLDGYKTAPAKIEIVKIDGAYTTVKISIKEGKNRQVKRMCEEINHKVASLKRIATGRIFLGELEKGEYRHLTAEEVKYLKDDKVKIPK